MQLRSQALKRRPSSSCSELPPPSPQHERACTTRRRTASVRPFVICAQMPLNPSSRVPPVECIPPPGRHVLAPVTIGARKQALPMPNFHQSGVCPNPRSTPMSVSSKCLRGCGNAQSVRLSLWRSGLAYQGGPTVCRSSLPRCRCRLCQLAKEAQGAEYIVRASLHQRIASRRVSPHPQSAGRSGRLLSFDYS
jgi:hypothetical protein